LRKVTVFALPEAVPSHVDRGAKPRIVGVECGNLRCVGGLEQLPDEYAAVHVELATDGVPVSGLDAVPPRAGPARGCGCRGPGLYRAHAAASRESAPRCRARSASSATTTTGRLTRLTPTPGTAAGAPARDTLVRSSTR